MEGSDPASNPCGINYGNGAHQDENCMIPGMAPLTFENSDYKICTLLASGELLTSGNSGGTAETGFAISSNGSQAVPNQSNQNQLGLGGWTAVPCTRSQAGLIPNQSNQNHLLLSGTKAIPGITPQPILVQTVSNPNELTLSGTAAVSSCRPQTVLVPNQSNQNHLTFGGIPARAQLVLVPNQCNQNQMALGETGENIGAVSISRQQAAISDQNEMKRENDKNYRKRKPIAAISDQSEQRFKEMNENVKQERDYLLDENNLLRKELRVLGAEMEQMKHNDLKQQNVQQQFRAEFGMNFPDEKARVEAMKVIASCPGITAINLDMNNKNLILRGGEIDMLWLQQELNKVCTAKLLLYGPDTINEEKKKEKKVYMHPNRYPSMSPNGQSVMSPHQYYSSVASAYSHKSPAEHNNLGNKYHCSSHTCDKE